MSCPPQENAWTDLHRAVFACQHQPGDSEVVAALNLLESRRFDVNALSGELETVLHFACRCTSSDSYILNELYKMTYTILEQNVDPNQRNLSGETALMTACKNGNINAVRVLLEWTANNGHALDIEAKDNGDRTGLLLAMQSNSEEIVELITERLFLAAVETGDINTLNIYTNVANDGHSRPIEQLRISSTIWTKAVRTAMKNASKDILEILLKCDVLAEGQGESGNTVLHKIVNKIEAYNDDQLRLIEMLLESGKINVNAMNFESQTALGLLLTCGSDLCKKKHSVLFFNAIRLLLHCGASVNQKDQDGRTPLMIASQCMPSMKTILKWTEDTHTWLDIDAKDDLGRTVLMRTVVNNQPEAVEILLNAGASVNTSDHCGFTPLHHALCEAFITDSWLRFENYPSGFQEWTACSYVPRDSDELKKMKAINSILLKPKAENLFVNSMETVKLLLERDDVDVNALQYEGFSPLDIVEASIAEIPFAIIDTLKKKGAILNVYHHATKPMISKSDIDVTCVDFLLHRLSMAGFKRKVIFNSLQCIDIFTEGFSKLSSAVRNDMISAKDGKGRTPLHLAIMSCKRQHTDTHRTKDNLCLDIQITRLLLSLGCSVNEADIYGRTPLHYAGRKTFKLLLSRGADATIKDHNGILAIRKSKKLHSNSGLARGAKRFNKVHPRSDSNSITDTIDKALERIDKSFSVCKENKNIEGFVQTINANHNKPILWCKHLNPTTIFEVVWKSGEYAYRHISANTIKEEVTMIVNDIANEIAKRDWRFEAKPKLVGSSNEGTRIDQPDEFDFDLVLTKFSELCEVSLSPELPPGYVHLRRKQTKVGSAKESEFDSFFTEDGILIAEKVKAQFNIMLANILKVIECQRNFDWNWNYWPPDDAAYSKTDRPATALRLKALKFSRIKTSYVEEISVDIVPCIHIEGWWPDEAIPNASEDIKRSGCILVFDRPQRFYPWVPYSESCVRISFAPAESEMIKRSCDTARQVFMIGKQLLRKRWFSSTDIGLLDFTAEYLLKNCLLYCIDCFAPKSEIFRKIDVSQWLEGLMKCVLDFLLQDFCPCYFMPNFCLPIDKKRRNDRPNDPGYFESRLIVFKFCCIFSMNASKVFLRLPSSNVIFEHFDRRQYLAELSKAALKSSESDSQDFAEFNPDTCDDECEHEPYALETDSDND